MQLHIRDLTGGALAAVLAAFSLVQAYAQPQNPAQDQPPAQVQAPAQSQPYGSYGYGGYGYGYPGMMGGRGMMGGYGPGMMGGYGGGMMGGYGPGMMGGYGGGMMGGYGPGMMGGRGMMGGYGPGVGGYGYAPGSGPGQISASDVKTYLERWIATNGNPHLRVGAITQRDANTIVGDVVTSDKGVLVQRFAFDRNTGAARSVQ
ncbi:hypothetical protein [Phenylobacterium soli]|uniref:hypothetical protein n=1 Tax=Phenylobacterium soli TaxID=2170551 RepID=UPI001874453C|nr:hypothetical protein [Phenylobacterium soli]